MGRIVLVAGLLLSAGCAHGGDSTLVGRALAVYEAGGGGGESGERLVILWASWCARCIEALEWIPERHPCAIPLEAVSVDADPRLAARVEARLEAEAQAQAGSVGWQWRRDPGAARAQDLGLRRLPALLWVRGRTVLAAYQGWDTAIARRLEEDFAERCRP